MEGVLLWSSVCVLLHDASLLDRIIVDAELLILSEIDWMFYQLEEKINCDKSDTTKLNIYGKY